MSRRVNRVAVALLALSLSLPASSAFAARRQVRDPGSFFDRLERIVKILTRNFGSANNSDGTLPPKP